MKRFATFVVCSTLAALFYVHAGVMAVTTGYQIRKQETEKVQIQDRLRALNYNISQLESPHNLERRLVAQSIALQTPDDWQKLVLPINVNKANDHLANQSFAQRISIPRFFIGTASAEAKEQKKGR